DPAHLNARNGLATLHAEQGEFSQAIAIWRDLTAGAAPGPAAAFLFSNLGYAHFLNGEYEQALAALEKACLLDPLNHRAWQHLGSALARLGQDERAQLMLRQASALRQHDFKADYAIAPRAGLAAIDSAVTAHTEVRATASGMFELHNVRAAPLPLVLAAPDAILLEIRNGNGVTGMARSLARSMDDPGLRVVRLSNQKGFGVQQTRIEYQPAFRAAAERLAERFGAATVVQANTRTADMRLVIGRDLIRAKPVLALKPGPREAG
ncbi:MAG TPA: LytR C-terminal domain-containing protein, partial [Telluria sp.]|nr:LytR C-terminal domain-containing protein [Telluria sp.]